MQPLPSVCCDVAAPPQGGNTSQVCPSTFPIGHAPARPTIAFPVVERIYRPVSAENVLFEERLVADT